MSYRELLGNADVARSMHCKHHANEVRSLFTFKLLSIFNKNELFKRSKLKDIS